MSSNSDLNRAPRQNGMENRKSCWCVSKMLEKIRTVLRKIIKHQSVVKIVVGCYIVVVLATAVLGFMNLWSSCESVRRISIFFVVKSATAALFWIVIVILLCKMSLQKYLDNDFYMVYLIVDSIFGIIWMIMGTIWVFNENIEHLSNCGSGLWHKGVAYGVYGITCLNWSFVAAFVFFYGMIACAKRNGNYSEERQADLSQNVQENAC